MISTMGTPRLPQGVQLGTHAGAQSGIERGKRLIEQQARGRAKSARARAVRWRCPPESSCGYWWATSFQSKHIEPAFHVGASVGCQRIAPALQRAKGDVLAHVEVQEQGVVLEQVGHGAPAGRWMPWAASNKVSPSIRTWPASGRTSPASTLSSMLLPAPEGPTTTARPACKARFQLERAVARAQCLCEISTSSRRMQALHRVATRPHRTGASLPTASSTATHTARRDEHQQVGHIVPPGLHGLVHGESTASASCPECCPPPSAWHQLASAAQSPAAPRPGCRARPAAA